MTTSRTTARPTPPLAATLLAALALAGCGGGGGAQSPLNPAGEQAARVFSLLQTMTWVCGSAYVLVLGFLGWSLWRARRPMRAAGAPGASDRRLDRTLVIWAALVVTGLSVLIVASFFADRALAAVSERDALEVRVTAHQWWWRIEYRDPSTGAWVETANELHLPAGRTARVALGSADVIHSFWVPNVAGKMDVIPGRDNVVRLTPHRAGWFRGQCAEFCGTQHAHMAFDVKVESADDFAAWLASQANDAAPPADDPVLLRGRQVVTGGACAECHVVRGTAAAGRPGPDLTHVGSRRSIAAADLPMSRGSLQGWIVQPQALKPGTLMPAVSLEPADADAAARYLASLR